MQNIIKCLFSWNLLLAMGLLCIGLITGCMFKTTSELIADDIVRRFAGDGAEIPFWVGRFQSDKGRWPKDFKELQAFVSKKSNGAIAMAYYDQVTFVELPDGRLQVNCSRDNTPPVQYILLPESQK